VKFFACCVLPDNKFYGNCLYWCKNVRGFDGATQCFESNCSGSYGLTPYTCRCYQCCALERTQKIQAICTSVLSASKTQSKKSIILTSCTSTQRKRTKKELPNFYIKLLNYRHPIVPFYRKRGLGPDQNHYNQSRRWSWLQTTLAQLTRIVPKWIYTVLKIFSQFTIFEQLPLALKTEFPFPLKLFTVLNVLFTIQDFWATALALKTELPWNFSLDWIYFLHSAFWATRAWSKRHSCLGVFHCIEIYFIIQDFWATRACSEKQSCPGIFHCIDVEYTFCIQDFWATSACSEKQRVPWIHCTEYVFFIIQIFEQLALALKNRVALEFFTVLNIYFLSFRIFEQLALALRKTELPCNISLYWNIFYHPRFLSNSRMPWKQSLPWKFLSAGGRPSPSLVRLWE